ncbi:glycoside hydrolase family 63 protein [Patellaria atrata CBS 101060]|uniref:Mannosyl-oligosaccharide glucosidase n=1 Tax=Patellaria atrata CBS 101060 TaxID=1346257 RepID=A0A9P4S6L1_9PEZI|nr:glycoside hydrolase family 63 protein [Patellaria atrata CBS 101060]
MKALEIHIASLTVSLVLLSLFNPTIARSGAITDETESIESFEKASNQSLLWGPYRPNLYFGLRPRIPKSLLLGLMWSRVEDYQTVQHNFRHTCEQNENMAGYGWDSYDARTGGHQTIHDAGNGLDLTTSFVKFPGGEHGGSWGVRIKGKPREDFPSDLRTTLVFYVAREGLGTIEIKEQGDNDDLGFEGDVKIEGDVAGLGEFDIVLTKGKGEHPLHQHQSYADKPLDRAIVHSFSIPDEGLWQTKPLLFAHIKTVIDAYLAKYGKENPPPPEQIYTMDHHIAQGNVHMVQKTFQGEFEFDVLYSSNSATIKPVITSKDVTHRVNIMTESFSDRFSRVFKPVAPFNYDRYLEFSKSLFSNLLGGIGYFHGDARVDRSYAEEYEEENEGFWEDAEEARNRHAEQLEGPSELFTSIPSRPFFPRGFLWDEGFHLLPIIDWDVDLTLDIIKSWFNLMDDEGWIAREQILGAEARSKVPPEFQVQYPHYANPPTLFMVLTTFIEKLRQEASTPTDQEVIPGVQYSGRLINGAVGLNYLKELYPLLKRQYAWFKKTQRGEIKAYDREAFSTKEAYRWRGRTPRHILTSGLDDYPRAQPPHPGELHVDLISWMGMMTSSLRDIATTIGEDEDAAEFAKNLEAIKRNIDDLHWSEKEQAYCDATIDDYEESVHVCHKGYISLFPFITGLLDNDSKKLKAVLDLIANPEELWSTHGIRSLSLRDPLYGTDENYWRGPVWININYLIVLRLLEIAQAPSGTGNPYKGRAMTMYQELRINLVKTVFESWKETGFAWEQYNPDTGAGQRTQHFTGWTSLVVKIMRMPNLEGTKRVRDEL